MGGSRISFQDVIDTGILGDMGTVSLYDVALTLLISLIVGLFIYYIYKKSFRGVVYNHSFNVTLIMMTMITSLIIMTISTNIILSLGMVGALSIVRFRTAIKDPLDIVFMFWSISVGIATGAKIYPVAIVGSIILGLTVFVMSRYKIKGQAYLLIIHYLEEADYAVNYHLTRVKHTLKSKTIRKDHTEIVVEMKLKDDNTELVKELSTIEGVTDVSLVSYTGDYAP